MIAKRAMNSTRSSAARTPTQNREGCPPRQTLVELAARARAVGDPAYRHLSNCSECYREFRALQDNPTVRTATTLAASRVRLIALAATAVLAVGLGGMWFALNRVPARGLPVAVRQPPAAELRAELDLRKFVVMRSDQTAEPAPPVLLPVGLVDLTLLLPVGSEPGAYDIQLLDSDLKSRAAARGDAALQNYVTTIRATVDLRAVPAGAYQLAIRRQGDDWRMFPARVQ